MTVLPAPLRSRWQPLRIGLVDLFHYDVEEFHFRDGRLLLRGNNGTGKSKVLALTLPFLLDGDLTPRRVEPDGDPGKRMEWNLLLGGDHPHPERLGYTWIEFGRRDDTSGEEYFRTLACGLKAVTGRGIARHWFVVTDQRVGRDLSLVDPTGTALSRDRLAEAVTGHGMVYDQARAYRRAVDEALFGLGEQRYAALVDLALQDALSRHGHTASARMVEDGMVVDIVYQGRERAVPELAEALAAEVGELTRILSAHEREILETHLITEVAGTLQELIGTAERQVRAMNAELEERPTSTGMRLRLVWRPSRKAPTGLDRARERLRQSADAWTPEDRSAVGEFLQEQIARQQTDDAAGTWLEHLTAALDYRAWHEFGVERHQQGRWVPATGPASGGERVLAVSVPLFAAASSHYASAGSPHAPRLVTLDEAFAGVDDDSRAKCLGLLHAFDLDVVMTSEREWACYPQVPGIAIAQLSRVDEMAVVLVTRWEWDGATRRRREDPVHQQHSAVRADDQEALWT
ncbi:hypothetical protein CTZ27_00830 [Streptomyces griseocarneus]|nr:hypothetical protein CTZ27_00830 [Streptomyces griseocarneus]